MCVKYYKEANIFGTVITHGELRKTWDQELLFYLV